MRRTSLQDASPIRRQGGQPETKATGLSPVMLPGRKMKPSVAAILYGRAAGHCSFDGCRSDITEHHVTKTPGNYGEGAHVVAFRERGPRGETVNRPEDINVITNLMLLCGPCHKRVDDAPSVYPRQLLEQMKRKHEEFVRDALISRPKQKTCVIVFQAPIAGMPVHIPDDTVRDAILPRYPASSTFSRIDLNAIAVTGETADFYATARDVIRREVATLHEAQSAFRTTGHASVFALAPIPLLIDLGAALTDKIPAEFFQKQQNTQEGWSWLSDDDPLAFEVTTTREGPPGAPVVLCLSISGSVDLADIPPDLSAVATIYDLRPIGVLPHRSLIRGRQQIDAFRAGWIKALAIISDRHGARTPVNLMPAVPVSAALVCGRVRHSKAGGALRVFDLRRDQGGYKFAFEVSHAQS